MFLGVNEYQKNFHQTFMSLLNPVINFNEVEYVSWPILYVRMFEELRQVKFFKPWGAWMMVSALH